MTLIILDRDGVINVDSDEYIKLPAEWVPLPGSLEAIAQLNQAGYQVVVATNQSGIGRRYFNEGTLAQIHAKMQSMLAEVGGHVDAIYYCPHLPEDHCECRKPKAGMLRLIGEDFTADLTQALCVGDSLRDLQAAQQVGAEAVLVKTGKGMQTLAKNEGLEGVAVYEDLSAVVAALLRRRN